MLQSQSKLVMSALNTYSDPSATLEKFDDQSL